MRDMEVEKLYVIKDGGHDLEMLLTHCLLHPIDYKLVRAECGGHVSGDVRAMFHEECIDLLEYEVIKSSHKRTLDWVIHDVYDYVAEWINVDGVVFVAETVDGKYVQFDMKTIDGIKKKELEEEWL